MKVRQLNPLTSFMAEENQQQSKPAKNQEQLRIGTFCPRCDHDQHERRWEDGYYYICRACRYLHRGETDPQGIDWGI